MYNERVANVIKKSKPFKTGDLFVYLAVLVIITALFLSFVILPNRTKTSGFSVTVDGELYFSFTPTDKSLVIADGKESFIERKDTEDGVFITVYTLADKSEYNVIFFDVKDLTAKVTESNCSTSHDCTFTPEIKDSGAIYCAPHALKIAPTSSDGFSEPTTG